MFDLDSYLITEEANTTVRSKKGAKSDFEKCIQAQIKSLSPNCSKIEARGSISDYSHGIEIFITVDGKRMQCYDMVDNGLLDEKRLNSALKKIANSFREEPGYKAGKSNKFSVAIEGHTAFDDLNQTIGMSIVSQHLSNHLDNKIKNNENRKKREYIDLWLGRNDISTTDESVKSFILTHLNDISNTAVRMINKIYQTSSFKKKFNDYLKKKLNQHTEQWAVYSPNCIDLTPIVSTERLNRRRLFDKSKGIQIGLFNNEQSVLYDNITSSEDDNSVFKLFYEFTAPLDDVGNKVVEKLKKEYKDMIDLGLISIEYNNTYDSDFPIVPEIYIEVGDISTKDGRKNLFD